jgi:PKD repeat protein
MSYFRVVALTVLCLSAWSRVDAATATWDRNPEPVLGYILAYGTQPGVHTVTIDVGNVNSYVFFPPPGQLYYVVVRAYNEAGTGPNSAEVVLDLRGSSNQPPTLAQPPNQSTTRSQPASLQLVGSDPENAALTYSASGLPPGLAVTASSGLISGTPTTAGTYTVTATVSDGSLSASRTFTWTINAPANQPPTLTQPSNQSTVRNQAASLTLVGSDPEGAPLTYSASGLPPGLAVNASSGVISGTPTTAGAYTVTATVRDPASLSASRTFSWTITVPSTNQPPTLAQPANQSTVRNQWASMQLFGSDPEGAALTYSASGLPAGLAVNTSSGIISGTPTTAGAYTVTATVRDPASLSASRTFSWTITVPSTNQPPTLAQPANQSTALQQAASLQLVGSDPEGASLAYLANGLPPGLALNATTGVISGRPFSAGTFTVSAMVYETATSLSASRTFTWTVGATSNQPPTLAQPANQSTVRNQPASLQLVGSDPEGAALTYSASGLPPGLTVNSSSGVIAGTPNTAGTFSVTATVSDSASSASRTFSWTVTTTPTNQPPTLAQPANQSTVRNQPASLQLVGSDPEGAALTYSAAGLPPGLTVNSSSGVIAGTPNTAGTFSVTATVSDSASSASRTFSWTVTATPTNQPPTLAQPANQSTALQQAASLQLVGSDPEGASLAYLANGLPPGLALNGTTGLISGRPFSAGTFTVSAMVYETATSLSASRTFTWTIGATSNQPPTLAQPANQSTVRNQPASLQLVGSDPEGAPLSYSASGLPPGLTVNPSSGVISGTPTVAGSSTVTATVSDGSSTASRSFTWTVTSSTTQPPSGNQPPTLAQPANQSTALQQAASLQLVGSDPEGASLAYLANGLPPGLAVNATTGVISGRPFSAGTFTVSAMVYETATSLSASRTFSWTITNSSAAGDEQGGAMAESTQSEAERSSALAANTDETGPAIEQPANQESVAASEVSLQIDATATAGGELRYEAAGLPRGLSIDAATGLIAGALAPDSDGVHDVRVTVSEGTTSASRLFSWVVRAAGIGVRGDFDGDGQSDPAVFLESTGEWIVWGSSVNFTRSQPVVWGVSGDLPVPADYDGDQRTDFATYSPQSGTWRALLSSSGYQSTLQVQWGNASDRPVTIDYDHDGRADLALPRARGFEILLSSSNYTRSTTISR